MNVTAIIQARMGSTRLPGKVLAEVGGRSMLAWVCHRVHQAALVDQIVVATSALPVDESIVGECEKIRVSCFRGSEKDVLDRYDKAAKAHGADVVVRITADCPLIDPQVIDEVVHAFLESQPDYASNTLKRSWPRGLDTEVMTAAALARASREATKEYHRAHVTPYIYEHPGSFRLISVSGSKDLGAWRWTVDVQEDLEFVRAIYARLMGQGTFSWRDVERLLIREPDLAKLNQHICQKQSVEG